jgi:hypothetical protein
MLVTPLPCPPASADLKDLLISSSHHAFHAQLGRSMKKPGSAGDGIYVGFRSGSRDSMRSLDFKKPMGDKKVPYCL